MRQTKGLAERPSPSATSYRRTLFSAEVVMIFSRNFKTDDSISYPASASSRLRPLHTIEPSFAASAPSDFVGKIKQLTGNVAKLRRTVSAHALMERHAIVAPAVHHLGKHREMRVVVAAELGRYG